MSNDDPLHQSEPKPNTFLLAHELVPQSMEGQEDSFTILSGDTRSAIGNFESHARGFAA
jgi:hypothetical protein